MREDRPPHRDPVPESAGTTWGDTVAMEERAEEPPTGPLLRHGAVAVGLFAVAEVVAAVVLAAIAGFSARMALTSFLATNGLMGASFALSGVLIARHRPRNALGWLLVADGLGHATSALMAPLARLLFDHHAPMPVLRLVLTVFMASWPWSIALFLPMALLVFPDGHLPDPRWRYPAWAIVLTSPLFVVEMVSSNDPVQNGLPLGYGTFAAYDDLSGLWTISELRVVAAILLATVALVVRYRRADETVRRQLLWLLLAALAVIVAVAPWSFVAGTPIVVLFAIPLVPVAIGIAVVRHQLLDIRLVVSRAVAWLMLSLTALAAYGALVLLVDSLYSQELGRSALPTVLVAVAMAPLLPRLQREVDRWMYGDRGDPARVARQLGQHLVSGAGEDGLRDVASALRAALRLPYVAVSSSDGALAADGSKPARTVQLPLRFAGSEVGSLVVGLRPGERVLSSVDDTALQLVAAPLAVALRALALSGDLQLSRAGLVLAREEERRRLRRDLHDGLGPTLTGVALSADAAANLLDDEPERSRELLYALRRDTRTAIADVRRLVENLRPPALDDVGLLGALRQRADQLRWRGDGHPLEIQLHVPDRLPALPAAVEVAAYRITTEALVNVSRHATATEARVEMNCHDSLDIAVTDDGQCAAAWTPGAGMEGMRARAAEVGGHFEAGPSARGGRVFVSIPLVAT